MHLPPAHVATVVGFALALVLLGRELRARAPSVTLAWFLAIVLVPYVGVPLYLMFGGRKLRRRAAEKDPLYAEAPRESRTPAAGLLPVERLLDAMGVPPTTHDNTLTVLGTGEEGFAALIELIDGAKERIHVATFILGADETGDAVLARLTARAKEGLEVRLLVDALFRLRAPGKGIDLLKRAGGRVAFFMPFFHVPFRGRSNLRNHRKIAVADGVRAVVGGMNVATEYMGPTPRAGRWKDVALRVEGGAAAALDAIFRQDWAFAAGERLAAPPERAPAAGAVPVRVVASGPDVATDTLYDAILLSLFSAQSRIWIATPYFVPDEALVRALLLACRRGIDVRVVVPHPSNHLIEDLAGATYLRDIERAGGAVRPFTAGMLHAKVIVIDDVLAMVGSANLDMRSLFLNYEVMAVLYGPREIAELAAWLEKVIATCAHALPPAGHVRAVAEDIGRLIGPLV